MTIGWKTHYTGTETYDPTDGGRGLYVQRDGDTKKITFVRYHGACVFIGYLNHLKMADHNWGVELSLPRFRVGLALPARWSRAWRVLNPRLTPPERRWWAHERSRFGDRAIRLGWLCLGW